MPVPICEDLAWREVGIRLLDGELSRPSSGEVEVDNESRKHVTRTTTSATMLLEVNATLSTMNFKQYWDKTLRKHF